MTKNLRAIEQQLFNDFADWSERGRDPIFIVGAPRTGSTLLYLLLIKRFRLAYFANVVNDIYPFTPAIGTVLCGGREEARPVSITLNSRFGHTVGAFQPSEAKNILDNWFPIAEPTETMSTKPRSESIGHLRKTFDFIDRVCEGRFVIKNAWNCFRIPYWAGEFENAKFIWIRRRLADAALSDLHARYVIQGSPLGWNAATPRNVDEITALPYAEQVVENQLAYQRAVSSSLEVLSNERHNTVWYHDLLADPGAEIERLGDWLGLEKQGSSQMYDTIKMRSVPDLPAGDAEAVKRYAARYAEGE